MTTASAQRDFDVVIYGATGFTGRLVAEYLGSLDGDLRWAMAARNSGKLRQVATELGLGDVPQITADSSDPTSLEALVKRTRVVITTVGPYALHGTPLIEACAKHGTHYCDLTGEPQWMAEIYERISALAHESGARLVHCCGFDSIPSDLSVMVAQQTMEARHGCTAKVVSGRMGRAKGGFSGGTAASLMLAVEQASRDARVRRLLKDPYALYPADIPPGEDEPDQTDVRWDDRFDAWTAPFVMASINSKVVRRSNALAQLPYGADFRYDEAQLCKSRAQALLTAGGLGFGMVAAALAPTRALLKKVLPDPGEGPNETLRENGFFEFFAHAEHPEDSAKDIRIRVFGKRDPGYGATSRMLAEAGLCLAFDRLTVGGGIWTPASALGGHLVARLEKVDITFQPVD
jgi:short subunit dehydrogenase-like uncharacterized protein